MFKCIIHIRNRSFPGFGPTRSRAKEEAERCVERAEDPAVLKLPTVEIEIGETEWEPGKTIFQV